MVFPLQILFFFKKKLFPNYFPALGLQQELLFSGISRFIPRENGISMSSPSSAPKFPGFLPHPKIFQNSHIKTWDFFQMLNPFFPTFFFFFPHLAHPGFSMGSDPTPKAPWDSWDRIPSSLNSQKNPLIPEIIPNPPFPEGLEQGNKTLSQNIFFCF